MKKIEDIKEVHRIVLDIAKVFDKIGRENDIQYWMLGGTMLGAVRHKGFIPWDDDMDFGVPREYYEKMKTILQKELPWPYKVALPGSLINYSNYIKIYDTRTCMDDPTVFLPIEKQMGCFIDVFPLDYCYEKDCVIRRIRGRLKKISLIYFKTGVWYKDCIKRFVQKVYPVSRKQMTIDMDNEINMSLKTEYWGNLYGHWQEKEIVPVTWYGMNHRYTFDGLSLLGFENYDAYLKQLYGDYMALPPINCRHTHGVYYWKDGYEDCGKNRMKQNRG